MIPALQAAGALNPDITQTQINVMPNMLAEAIEMESAPINLKVAFKNPKVKQVNYEMSLEVADDYGNLEKHLIVKFSMPRTTASKINWENFGGEQLPHIVHMYFTPWFSQNVQGEIGAEQ